jgi:hypothetical protein
LLQRWLSLQQQSNIVKVKHALQQIRMNGINPACIAETKHTIAAKKHISQDGHSLKQSIMH